MKKHKKPTKGTKETLELKKIIQLQFEAFTDPEDNDNLKLIIMRQTDKDTDTQ